MFRHLVSLLFLTVIFTACSGGRSNPSAPQPVPTTPPPPSTTAPIEFEGLSGTFQSIGHGFVIDLNYEQDTLQLFHVTETTCVFDPAFDVSLGDLLAELDVGRTAGSNDDFTVKDPINDRQTTFFERISNKPSSCLNGGDQPSNDPEMNFQTFWETFNEHYAFFAERNIDWAAQYEIFRPQVTSTTSQLELFQILSNLAGTLVDTHVSIDSSFGNYNSGDNAAFVAAQIRADRPEINTIIESYLDAGFSTELGGNVRYGSINNNIGYIQISLFQGSTFTLAGEEEFLDIIDVAINQFQDHIGIIFDVRNSPGGLGGDGLATRIVNRFTDIERQGFQEQVRDGEGFSPLITFNILPEGPMQFLKPVVVLAGTTSVSTPENFTLLLKQLPQATFVGQATNGTLSTRLHKLLPNGFSFTLTNEIQRTPMGMSFEVIGAQPDITVENFTDADINAGIDSALQAAVDLLTDTM